MVRQDGYGDVNPMLGIWTMRWTVIDSWTGSFIRHGQHARKHLPRDMPSVYV